VSDRPHNNALAKPQHELAKPPIKYMVLHTKLYFKAPNLIGAIQYNQ
jgi:hypothetical protein